MAGATTRFPVSVVIEKVEASHRRWRYPHWSVLGVVAGRRGESDDGGLHCQRVHGGGTTEQSIWSGLSIELQRAAVEHYWLNLVGRQPALFVVCRAADDGAMRPFAVSADYDEAGAYMEADDAVFSVPIPPEVYRWLERYVLDNHRPAEPRRRRRGAYAGETRHG